MIGGTRGRKGRSRRLDDVRITEDGRVQPSIKPTKVFTAKVD